MDLLWVAVIWPLGVLLASGALPPESRPGPWPMLLYPAAYMAFLYALGLYRREALVGTRQAIGRVPFAAGLGGFAASAVLLVSPSAFVGTGDKAAVPALFAATIIGLSAAGVLARACIATMRQVGLFRRRLMIIGAGPRAWDLVWLLRKEGRTLAYDIACVHGPEMGPVDPRLERDPTVVIIPAKDGFLATAQRLSVDQIVVAPDERRGLDMMGLLACRAAGFPVSEYLRFLEHEIGRIDVKRFELGWLLYADGFERTLLDRVLKRLLDMVVSLSLLIVTAPLLIIGAIAVRLQDGGPVMYRQERVTRNGRSFMIMKLRTMLVEAERNGATWAAEADPRVTAIGRLLRRTRVDELPQLINVLGGDMSIVGPRPERPEFTSKLAAELPLYDERHRVKAGLTGWAQVNYPYGASIDDTRSKLSYDLYYVKNGGVVFDLLILMQTLRVVLWPGGGAR
jgi:sugar transferase (PEP-CTERM system associated)